MLGMNDFFRRATHVDIDPHHSPLLYHLCCFCKHLGIVPEKLHEQRLFGGIIIKFGPHSFTADKTIYTREFTEEDHFGIQPSDNLSVGGIRHPVHRCQANYRTLDFRPAHANIREIKV